MSTKMSIEEMEEEMASLEEKLGAEDSYASDGDDAEFEVTEDELPQLDASYDTVVVVIGIPVIPSSKVAKLNKLLLKIFKQFGKTLTDKNMFMPFQKDKDKSLGSVYIEYDTVAEAKKCVANAQNYRLDKKHTFKIYMYNDMQKLLTVPDNYTGLPETKYQERDDLYEWLVDENSRDQFAIRQGKNTEIFWIFGPTAQPPEVAYDGSRERAQNKTWCERQVTWSPNGTYFVTFHPQGIVLWGGDTFEKVNRFVHFDVMEIQFSPNEQYIMTWNGNENKNDKSICLWDRRNGKLLKEFKYDIAVQGPWPCFSWSHDDKYFARKGRDLIMVYESETCSLLRDAEGTKRSLKAPGVKDFKWSPCGYDTKKGGTMATGGEPVLAYWSPENEADSTPASVKLHLLPSRKVLRYISRSMVDHIQLIWHPLGEYLCVQVKRHKKSKKTYYTNFEIFRMKDVHKEVAVEHFKQDEDVVQFQWEPVGTRFAYIYGNSAQRGNIDMYTMGEVGKKGQSPKMEKIYTMENRQANRLFWSPMGNFLVIAGLDNINGQLEFWDADNESTMCTQEHFMCNLIAWDPSGRVCCTAVCQPMFGTMSMRYQLENGFKLWTFQGAPMYDTQRQNFYSFEWRPRPRMLLSSERQLYVKRNLKKKIEAYAEADRQRAKAKADEKFKKQKALIDAFTAGMERRHARYLEFEKQRRAAGIETKDEDDYETVVTYNEVVLSREETVYE